MILHLQVPLLTTFCMFISNIARPLDSLGLLGVSIQFGQWGGEGDSQATHQIRSQHTVTTRKLLVIFKILNCAQDICAGCFFQIAYDSVKM